MELASVGLAAAATGRAAQETGNQHAIAMTSKAISAMQAEGQMLVQLIDQAGGVGRNINITG